MLGPVLGGVLRESPDIGFLHQIDELFQPTGAEWRVSRNAFRFEPRILRVRGAP
jgi:hypothetical protein